MTVNEGKKAMDEMMAQGTTEEEMLGILYLMFQDDKLTFEELEALVDALGYEITEEFRNMSPEDQKTKGYETTDDTAEEGVSEEDIEDAKEVGGDEDGGNEPEEDEGASKDGEEDKKDNASEKDEDEEAELDKARKLYGFDK